MAASSPQSAFRNVVVRSLAERWRKYESRLRDAHGRPAEKNIHDLRVATRRLLASVTVSAALLPANRVRRARRALGRRLTALTRLRDCQVQLRAVRNLVRRYPVLRSFANALAVEERKARRAAVREIARDRKTRLDLGRVQSELLTLLAQPGMETAWTAAAMGQAAAAFSRAVFLRMRLRESDVRSIHRLRVAFKKFRYTAEALQSLLPGITPYRLKKMDEYQTAMGVVQDADVLLADVESFLRRRPALGPAMVSVRDHCVRRRTELAAAFLGRADMLFGFWSLRT